MTGLRHSAGAFGKGEAGKHGSDDNREKQRAEQREGHGPGHGTEEAAFHALEGEDRQEGGDGDDDGVEDRALHFVRRIADFFDGSLDATVPVMERVHNVFDEHDCAFDEHAEVESADRQQVCRNMAQVEANGGKKQRERNGRGHDQRAANVAEEQEKNERDKNHSFRKVVQHGVRRVVHELAAIDEGYDVHTRRKNVVLSSSTFRWMSSSAASAAAPLRSSTMPETTSSLSTILPFSLWMARANWPRRIFGPCCDDRDILDADGRAVLARDDGLLDVLHAVDQADGADVDLLQALLNEAAAGVHVVVGELLLDLREAQAVGDQLVRIDAHLILARRAAEAGDIDDVRE